MCYAGANRLWTKHGTGQGNEGPGAGLGVRTQCDLIPGTQWHTVLCPTTISMVGHQMLFSGMSYPRVTGEDEGVKRFYGRIVCFVVF